MANVSKKEFEALKDSINAWVAATSSLFDCHKNRAAALEARLAAAEKAGDKSIADLSARVDALARTVGRIAEDLEAPSEKPRPEFYYVDSVSFPVYDKTWKVTLRDFMGEYKTIEVRYDEAQTVTNAIDIALERARV